jgi:outer membrane murein-binding lipoprotein Lpp
MKRWTLTAAVVTALAVAGCSSTDAATGEKSAGGTTTSTAAAYSSSELSAMRAAREAAQSGDRTSIAIADAALRTVQQVGSDYEALSDSDFQKMVEDPDSFAGRKVVLYGQVLKRDGEVTRLATGPSLNLRTSQYTTTTVLTADDSSLLAAHESLDHVIVLGEVQGAISYDNPVLVGETATSPEVRVGTIKLLAYN